MVEPECGAKECTDPRLTSSFRLTSLLRGLTIGVRELEGKWRRGVPFPKSREGRRFFFFLTSDVQFPSSCTQTGTFERKAAVKAGEEKVVSAGRSALTSKKHFKYRLRAVLAR